MKYDEVFLFCFVIAPQPRVKKFPCLLGGKNTIAKFKCLKNLDIKRFPTTYNQTLCKMLTQHMTHSQNLIVVINVFATSKLISHTYVFLNMNLYNLRLPHPSDHYNIIVGSFSPTTLLKGISIH